MPVPSLPPQESLIQMEPARRQWGQELSRRYQLTALSAQNQPNLIPPVLPRTAPFLLKRGQAGLLAPEKKEEERSQEEDGKEKGRRRGRAHLKQSLARSLSFNLLLYKTEITISSSSYFKGKEKRHLM